jgi:hypothetical protein
MMFPRRWALGLAIVIGVGLAACQAGDLAGLPLPGTRRAVKAVVYTVPNIIPVGDTLRIFASAYDSTGYATLDVPRSWTVSDQRIARLDPLPMPGTVMLHGLSVGRVVIAAVFAGLMARDSVSVVPQDARVRLDVAKTSMRVGDTTAAAILMENVAPATVSPRSLFASTENVNVVEVQMTDTLGHARFIARGAGTVRVAGTLGRLRDETIMTVTP